MNYLAKEWVKALRSGEYKQTNMALHDDKGYCCLGVACDVLIKNGIELKVNNGAPWNSTAVTYDGAVGVLPLRAMTALGMRSCDGYEHGLRMSLAQLNDVEGYTFAEIADYIEANANALFCEVNSNEEQSI